MSELSSLGSGSQAHVERGQAHTCGLCTSKLLACTLENINSLLACTLNGLKTEDGSGFRKQPRTGRSSQIDKPQRNKCNHKQGLRWQLEYFLFLVVCLPLRHSSFFLGSAAPKRPSSPQDFVPRERLYRSDATGWFSFVSLSILMAEAWLVMIVWVWNP